MRKGNYSNILIFIFEVRVKERKMKYQVVPNFLRSQLVQLTDECQLLFTTATTCS
jgi:hypothetical protein